MPEPRYEHSVPVAEFAHNLNKIPNPPLPISDPINGTNLLKSTFFQSPISTPLETAPRSTPMHAPSEATALRRPFAVAAPLSSHHSIAGPRPILLPIPPSTSRPPALRLPFRPLAMRKRNPKRLKYANQRLYKKNDEKMLYVEVSPTGEENWKLDEVVELIKRGAVGIIPTDTVYGIVCDVGSHTSIERLRRIKGIGKTKPLSILCHSLRDIDTYTTGFPRGTDHGQTNIFKAAKHCLPGPYTFILPASKALPKQCIRHGTTTTFTSRKHVGVRIPDDAICQAILEKLDRPLITTSVKWPSEDSWLIDPVLIADVYGREGIDFIVDGGVRVADPSTVVDMTGSTPIIVRQGKGPKHNWMVTKEEWENANALLPTAA